MTTDLIPVIRVIAREQPDFVYESPLVPLMGSDYEEYLVLVERDEVDEDQQHNELGYPVKPTCMYRVGGEPSCIVGRALDMLEQPTQPEDENVGAEEVVPRRLAEATKEEIQYATQVQIYQDSGAPWGKAVAAADLMLEAGCFRGPGRWTPYSSLDKTPPVYGGTGPGE